MSPPVRAPVTPRPQQQRADERPGHDRAAEVEERSSHLVKPLDAEAAAPDSVPRTGLKMLSSASAATHEADPRHQLEPAQRRALRRGVEGAARAVPLELRVPRDGPLDRGADDDAVPPRRAVPAQRGAPLAQ